MNIRKNSLEKTKILVGMAIFTALVVVLQALAGVIKFGVFSPPLVLLPIVIGAASYGWKASTWLGFVFGVVALIGSITGSDAGGNMMWNYNAFVTALICLVKGTAAGAGSGLLYEVLHKKSPFLAILAAAIVCPLINTGLFIVGAVAVFKPLLEQWAGGTDLVSYLFLGMIGLNCLLAVVINALLTPVVMRILKIRKLV